jgi:hypothetical protein
MFTQWRVIKTDRPTNRWQLQSNVRLSDGTVSGWQALSSYPTRKQAVTVGMIMRDRGEPISWQGGAVRMGIALVESCKQEG